MWIGLTVTPKRQVADLDQIVVIMKGGGDVNNSDKSPRQ